MKQQYKLRLPEPVKCVELDQQQLAAQRIYQASGHVVVAGMPGSGLSTLGLQSLDAGALMVAPADAHAAALRSRLGPEFESARSRPVISDSALAFEIIDAFYTTLTNPAQPPVLLTGARLDTMISDLLLSAPIEWPEMLQNPEYRGSEQFRIQVRNALELCVELGITPDALRGAPQQFQTWRPLADLLEQLDFSVAEIERISAGQRPEASALMASSAKRLAAFLISRWDKLTDAPRPSWSGVVVDEGQSLSPAALELIRQVAVEVPLMVLATPARGTDSFRGTDAWSIAELSEHFGAQVVQLPGRYRTAGQISVLENRIVESSSIWPSLPAALEGDTQITSHIFEAAEDEVRFIASSIRKHHSEDGVPLGQMAVIARSRSEQSRILRRLRSLGIPSHLPASSFVFAEHPLANAILRVLSRQDAFEQIFTGPLIGGDYIQLSQLLSLVRQQEDVRDEWSTKQIPDAKHASDGIDDIELVEADQRLNEIACDPETAVAFAAAHQGSTAQPALAKLVSTSKIMRAAHSAHKGPATAGLSEVWRAVSVGERLQAAALRGDQWADDKLDAVVALARYADLWQQQNIHGSAGQFASEVLQSAVPVRNLAQTALHTDSVSILTPQAASAGTYEMLFLPQLQDGLWPNPTPQNQIFNVDSLPQLKHAGDFVPNRPQELRRQKIISEIKLFLDAISRSKRRVVLSAVDDEESSPSPILTTFTEPTHERQQRVPNLHALVAKLRRNVLNSETSDGLKRECMLMLQKLAADGISGADPITWPELASESSLEPAVSPVKLSPSAMDVFLTNPMSGFLGRNLVSPPTISQNIGMLMHKLAEQYPGGATSPEDLEARFCDIIDSQLTGMGLTQGSVKDSRTIAQLKSAASKLAKYLSGKYHKSTEQFLQTELQVGNRSIQISGMIDRLELVAPDSEEIKIVDFKTSSSQKSLAAAKIDPQLALYQYLAFSDLNQSPSSAQLVYLVGSTKSAKEVGQAGIDFSVDTELRSDLTVQQLQAEHAGAEDPIQTLSANDVMDMICAVANAMSAPRLPVLCDGSTRSCRYPNVCPMHTTARKTI